MRTSKSLTKTAHETGKSKHKPIGREASKPEPISTFQSSNPRNGSSNSEHEAREKGLQKLEQSAGIQPALFQPEMFTKKFMYLAYHFCCISDSSLSYVISVLLTCVSNLLSGLFLIQPYKSKPEFKIAPNLSGVIIGGSGTKKTPALNAVTKAIYDVEYEYSSASADEIDKLNSQRDRSIRVNNLLNQDMAKLTRTIHSIADESPQQVSELQQKIESFQRLLVHVPNQKFQLRKSIVCSPTEMGLERILAAQSAPLLLINDEISDFLETTCSSTRNAMRATLMTLMDGLGTKSFERANKDTTKLVNRALSIIGTAQPDRLSKLVKKVINNEIPVDGFLSRFALLVTNAEQELPESKFSFSQNNHEKCAQFWARLVRDCNQLSPVASVVPLDRTIVSFSAQAEEVYKEFIQSNQTRITKLKPLHQSLLLKQQSVVPSLALINAVFRKGGLSEFNHEILRVDITKAIAQTEVFESHFITFFKQSNNESYLALKLLEKLSESKSNFDRSHFTVSKIQKQDWSFFKTQESIKKALAVLQKYNQVYKKNRIKSTTGGRPTSFWSLSVAIEHMNS